MKSKKLVVCGGGNSSHILIPFLKDSIFDVYVYTSRPNQWSNTIELEWQDAAGKLLDTACGTIVKASNDPKELFHDADYVVFCMPVHKYRVALHDIAPYLNKERLKGQTLWKRSSGLCLPTGLCRIPDKGSFPGYSKPYQIHGRYRSAAPLSHCRQGRLR